MIRSSFSFPSTHHPQIDEEVDPASIEHFGISTVEAMSAGVIPVGLSRGGTATIVQHGVSGYLAGTKEDVIDWTVKLFDSSGEDLLKMQRAALASVAQYSPEQFLHNFDSIVGRGLLNEPFHRLAAVQTAVLRKVPLIVSPSSRNVAVIVEPLIRSEFEFSVRTTMARLGPDWSLCVVHQKSNAAFVQHVLKNVHNARFISIDHDLTTVHGYSRLLKALWFWRMLEADRVLIFQWDSVIVGGQDIHIEDFEEYDYVGAPWDKENDIWTSKHAAELIEADRTGNGGFSLRRVQPMLEICQDLGAESPDDEAEDIFFVKALAARGYSVAPREVAYRFAREVPIEDLPDERPFALHAAWYYEKGILDRYFPRSPGAV